MEAYPEIIGPKFQLPRPFLKPSRLAKWLTGQGLIGLIRKHKKVDAGSSSMLPARIGRLKALSTVDCLKFGRLQKANN